MRTLLLVVFLSALVQPAAANITMVVPNAVELDEVDRADLERRACMKPFNVRAARIQGESYSWSLERPLYARVTCSNHLTTPQYTAYYVRYCQKRAFGWTCQQPVLWVKTDFLGRGPYEIAFEDIGIDRALPSLSCLGGSIEAHGAEHQALDLRRSAVPKVLKRTRDKSGTTEVIEAYVKARDECLWVYISPQCRAGDDPPLLVAHKGCVDE
ncbi:MAG TPA: hypothetical protein VFV88_17000 [Steroidobacteraceae bacterium]|jgi:hypothetical protein|nr:hypothetical protein [Steroidobacteraceae bacterium]